VEYSGPAWKCCPPLPTQCSELQWSAVECSLGILCEGCSSPVAHCYDAETTASYLALLWCTVSGGGEDSRGLEKNKTISTIDLVRPKPEQTAGSKDNRKGCVSHRGGS